MLTIITGTPGAGKSLYTVWEEARKVPGSTVEKDGQPIPRRLLSNIKGLLLEHEVIGPAELDTWHTWAQPGDVIVFDEVQEVWRPRSFGSKVPDCIAALETHRHMGVDLILITQHPMLVDPNIRRLCNRHLHLRRLTRTMAMIYEWDHCANPGQVKTAIDSRVWFHPKKAYSLYKSAQLHTKPTARLPRMLIVGVLAAAAVAYLAPTAYSRMSGSLGQSQAAAKPASAASSPLSSSLAAPDRAGLPAQPGPVPPLAALASAPPPRVVGCVRMNTRCTCFDENGRAASLPMAMCVEGTTMVGTIVPLAMTVAHQPGVPALSVQPPEKPVDAAKTNPPSDGKTGAP